MHIDCLCPEPLIAWVLTMVLSQAMPLVFREDKFERTFILWRGFKHLISLLWLEHMYYDLI